MSWPPGRPGTTTTTDQGDRGDRATHVKTRSVNATWKGGYECVVRAGDFEIRVDEPVSSGGTDTGPQPTEVFLASFASCFALAIAHVARKRDVELPDLSVKATGTYDGPKFINIRLDVTSSHGDREELAQLVERASSVCYVSNTIRVVDDTEVVIANP